MAELKQIIAESERYLFQTEPIDPGPYLFIAHSMFDIARRGGLDITATELNQKILDRLETLKETGGIRPWSDGFRHDRFARLGYFSYGGYGFDLEGEIRDVFEAMSEIQSSLHEQQLPARASELLELFKTDLDAFEAEIAYTYYGVYFHIIPIFHEIDLKSFAAAFLKHLHDGRFKRLAEVFEKISIRHKEKSIWQDEKQWFKKLRCELKERASKRSKLAQAQLEHCFARDAFRDLREAEKWEAAPD